MYVRSARGSVRAAGEQGTSRAKHLIFGRREVRNPYFFDPVPCWALYKRDTMIGT